MEVEIYQLIEGAKKARGLVVIIDVFRAFSVSCYLFNNGAWMIIPVGEVEEACHLKEQNPDYVLIGERKGIKLPGFEYGNSPTDLKKVDFSGQTVVHTTSAGTQGIVNAYQADEIITGSFVNAEAVIRYILQKQPDRVTLVSMGLAGKIPAAEDDICANYIKNKIYNNGSIFDILEVKKMLKEGSGKRFFNPANINWSPPEDFELCLEMNKFDFVIRAERAESGRIVLKKYDLQ